MRKIWVVLRREFLERVRSKWFLISTIAGPLLMLAFVVVPVMVARRSTEERRIALLDATTDGFGARLVSALERSRALTVVRVASSPARLAQDADSLLGEVGARALDGFLVATDQTVHEGQVEYRGTNVSSPRDMQVLAALLEDAVFTERLARAGVDPRVVQRAKIRLDLKTTRISGRRATGESGQSTFVLAYVMWLVLYTGILLYGISVMSSVLEEKTTRIVEVLVSSLRPFELLAGKVLGVGAVGLFQFLIWAVAAAALVRFRGVLLAALNLPAGAARGFSLPAISLGTVAVFVTFFLLGYFLYAALFAAVGAMTSTETEARQAANLVVMLLVLPSLLMIGVLNDPSSSLAVRLSLIPFCAPVAMPVRWVAGQVPALELATSVALLALTLVATTWIAGRIYRVGILMYGKRPGLRELVRWVRTPA